MCAGSNPHGYSKTPQFGGERDCNGDPTETESKSSSPYCSRNIIDFLRIDTYDVNLKRDILLKIG